MKRLLPLALLLVASLANAATFNLYSPAAGVQKNTGSTYINTTAVSSDIRSMWSGTCDVNSFLRGDGACAAPTVAGAALTKTDDTNVTLTLGGSPTTALVNASSLTLGWTGQLAAARGGTGLSTVTDDTVLVANGTLWQSKALTSCSAGTSAMTYDTSTNTFGCNTISGSLPSSSQGDIIYASGTNTYTTLAKNTTATRYLSNTGTTNNPAWAQVALATGVSGTLPTANGGTSLTAAADDNVMVGDGSVWATKALTTCTGAGKAVTYDAAANAFGCNTIASGGVTAVANKITTTGNSAGSQTTVWNTSIGAGTLTADGQSITFYVAGTIAATSSTNKRFTVEFGDSPSNIFDSNSFGANTGAVGAWSANGTCIRTGAASARCSVQAILEDASPSGPPTTIKSYTTYTVVTSTWANAIPFQITTNGTNANDTSMTMGKILAMP